MSTKVKGEAIKEGSIPLSALATEVKEKIENAGGGADWNAQSGEAGYIENKPCYVNLNNGFRLTLDNANITLSTDQKRYEKIIFPLNESVISLYFYDYYGELRHYVLTEGQSVQDNHFGCTFTAVLNEYDLCNLVLTDFYDNKEYVDNAFAETKIVYEYNSNIIGKLDPIYLPDTVLKTTPQTLSDTDKNQALANLGIDPVVWKYMCNPFMVAPDYELSYEIHNMIWYEEASSLRSVILNTAQVLYNGTPHKVNRLIGMNKLGISTSDGEVVYEYDNDIKQFKIVEQ